MSTSTLSKTAPEIIREAAKLILKKGFGLMRGNTTADQLGVFGINLSTAVCWAIHGEGCRPRDLSRREAEHVAEVLDQVEDELHMTVDIYERKYCNAIPQNVAQDLRLAAWNLEAKLGLS
jgi:hypothetical protein